MEDLPLLPPVDPDFPATPIRIRTVWRSPSSKSRRDGSAQHRASRPKVVVALLLALGVMLVVVVLVRPANGGSSTGSVLVRKGIAMSETGERRAWVIVAIDGDPSARPIVADVDRAVQNGERVEVRMTPSPQIVPEPRPSLWPSLAFVLLLVPALIVGLVVIGRLVAIPRRRRMRANAMALEGPSTTSVRLVPWWSDRTSGVQLRFQVWPEGSDHPTGSVRFLYDPRWFDPRGTFAMYGLPTIGSPIAFRSNERDLTVLPIEAMGAVPAAAEHPCSALVSRLLGWRSSDSVVRAGARNPGGVFHQKATTAPTADDVLLVAVPASLHRAKRVAWFRFLATVVIVAIGCAWIDAPTWLALGLMAVALSFRQAVWPKAGTRWTASPLADAIHRREAIVPADADFVARALLAGGFPRCIANPAVDT